MAETRREFGPREGEYMGYLDEMYTYDHLVSIAFRIETLTGRRLFE